MRKVSGRFTVEACILFPTIFLFLMVYLQFALFFTASEYAKTLCDQTLILWQRDGKEEAEAFLRSRLSEQSMIGSAEGEATEESWMLFTKRTVALRGRYTLLFPMELYVHASGYEEEDIAFIRMTDLIWEMAGRIEPVREFLSGWESGE